MARIRRLQPPKLPEIARLPKFSLPLVRRGWRPVTIETEAEVEVPPGIVATRPEWLVYQWLERQGIVFDFQSSQLGGRLELGGAVADFVLPELKMIWRVMGTFWHLGDVNKEARDLIQKTMLMDDGWTVIDLYDTDILRARDRVCSDALRGVQWRKPLI